MKIIFKNWNTPIYNTLTFRIENTRFEKISMAKKDMLCTCWCDCSGPVMIASEERQCEKEISWDRQIKVNMQLHYGYYSATSKE